MTSTTNRVSVQRCSSPLTPPEFYTSKSKPPHHTSNGFVSPWPSAGTNDLFKFIRTRLFDWEESLLPSADALPPVRPANWVPTNTSKDGDIIFTWLAHAACHFQIPIPASQSGTSSASITILTDPVFSQRCSPSQSIGPKRYTNCPTSVQEMAESKDEKAWPDLLVLSHDHYDHLDFDTVKALLSKPNGKPVPHIFCPLGLASWFKKHLGVTDDGLTELDWWQDRIAIVKGNLRIKLTCVPAQHFSGRGLFGRNSTLWAGWTFEALGEDESSSLRGKKVYFAGDSGYRTVREKVSKEEEDKLPVCPAFKEIGEKLGPFDLSAIPIGAYSPRTFMGAVHMDPRDSVCVHQDVKSKKSIGIHWGSFRLTPEEVNEPPMKLKEEADSAGLPSDEFEVMGIGETRAF